MHNPCVDPWMMEKAWMGLQKRFEWELDIGNFIFSRLLEKQPLQKQLYSYGEKFQIKI